MPDKEKEFTKVLEELRGLIVEQNNMLRAVLWIIMGDEVDDDEETESPQKRDSRFFHEREIELLNGLQRSEN